MPLALSRSLQILCTQRRRRTDPKRSRIQPYALLKSVSSRTCRTGRRNTVAIQAPESKVQWTQDTEEVSVELHVAKSVSKKSIELEVHPRRLDLSIDGTSILSGTLDKEVDVDGSYWFVDASKETDESKCLTVVLVKNVAGHESFEHLLEEDILDTTITQRAHLDIKIDGKDAGMLIFGLFGKAAPEAVQNFLSFVNGRGDVENREDLVNARFTSVYPGRYAEFGLINRAENSDDSFYEEALKAERRGLKHVGPGLLSIDPEQGLTVFMLSFNPSPEFNLQRSVFGKVLHGMDLLARIEAQGNEESGEPVSSIVVSDCEEIEESQVEELLKKETKRRIYEEH